MIHDQVESTSRSNNMLLLVVASALHSHRLEWRFDSHTTHHYQYTGSTYTRTYTPGINP
jgi:hypothetical protein